MQLCLSEGRADGICVLRSGGLGRLSRARGPAAVPAVISQPHGPLGPGVFWFGTVVGISRQSWGRIVAGRSSALAGGEASTEPKEPNGGSGYRDEGWLENQAWCASWRRGFTVSSQMTLRQQCGEGTSLAVNLAFV